jgi:hypothetical protein
MKGQVQVISVIMITGIIITLVGAAYFWGAPLIEKRTAVTETDIAENFILDLNGRIVSIANTGAGESTLDIPHGLLKVIPNGHSDSDNNSVVLEYFVKQPMIFPNTVAYLDTKNIEEVAPYGEASPRVVSLRGERAGEGDRILLKLHYRELDINTTPVRGYRIALNEGMQATTGTSMVTVSFDRRETIDDGAANGGDLIVTHINLIVS